MRIAEPPSVNPGDVAYSVDAIPWEPAGPDGIRSALLQGSRQPGVVFSYAFFLPAGVWDRPHTHPADARIVVAQGELRLGYGKTFHKQASVRFPVGSYLFVPAGAAHYDGADVDTVIIGTAVGPWATDYLDHEKEER